MNEYQRKYGYGINFWINATYSTDGVLSHIPFTEPILRGIAENEAKKMLHYIENRDLYLNGVHPLDSNKW
jgi:hypothetical protein